jgi:electron transfer flavoprotein alpha subunit
LDEVKIAVCVKQVPEVSELVLDPVTRRLRRDGARALMNPFDRRAALEALRIRDEVGGVVCAISMGPPQAVAVLRECLGLGVDRAVHLCDPRFAGADTLATARALAAAITRIGADLVLAGRYSIDAETGQVGPEMAELLGMPFLGGVRRLAAAVDERTAGRVLGVEVRVECEGDEGGIEKACRLPVVVTCTDRWKTRIPVVLPDDERAASAPVEVWGVDDLDGDPNNYGQPGSPTSVAEVQTVELDRDRRVIDARGGLDDAVAAVLSALDAARAGGAAAARAPMPRHVRRADPRGAVWVLAERATSGAIRPVTRELLGAADALADALAVGVVAALVEPLPEALLRDLRRGAGKATTAPAGVASDLGRAGADCLLVSADGRAFEPDDFVAAFACALRDLAPRMLLAPATALGRDLVPALAARLGLGLTGDAVGVDLDGEGRLRQLKPAFGGQVVAPILSRTRPELVTLRPGVLVPGGDDPDRPAAEIVRCPAAGSEQLHPSRWLGFSPEVGEAGLALESASTVVCVGFGLGGAAGVPEVEELARALGGAVGATRRVCDAGWLPRQLQIGLSGRSVAPALYLGLGVRGSFNHTVGIRRAGVVIAVNRDPDAEVFAAADLGIVADAPAFVAALRARLGERR